MHDHHDHPHAQSGKGGEATRLEKDPVCGMTVDPGSAKHSAEYRGHTYYFCGQGCKTKFAANPVSFLGAQTETAGIGAGRHHLHLPHASRDPPNRPRTLSDLRHGARTRCDERGYGSKSRTCRNDQAFLDRARAQSAGGCFGDGRTPLQSSQADLAGDIELGTVCSCHARRALGGLAVF